MSTSMPEAPSLKDIEFQTSQAFAIFAENSELEVLQLSLPEIDTAEVFEMDEEEVTEAALTSLTSEGYIAMKNAKNAYAKGATLTKKSGSSLKIFNYDVT